MPSKISDQVWERRVAKDEYIEYIDGSSKQVKNDKYSKKFPKIKKVVCKCGLPPPLYLELRNDITNLGILEGNIHEIRYYMTYPKQKQPYIEHKEFSLHNQKRKPIRIRFPTPEMKDWGENLKEGILIFKFEGIGATKKFEKEIWIRISDDRKIIEWSESKIIIYRHHIKTSFHSVYNFFRNKIACISHWCSVKKF